MRATFSARYEQRTDAQLLQAFYLGEENALSLLADRLWRPLTQFALSRLPSTEVGRYQLSEDLVQETIIKVAQTKQRSKTRWQHGKSSVFTWIGTILKNIIHSYLRTKKNRIRVTSDLISSSGREMQIIRLSKILLTTVVLKKPIFVRRTIGYERCHNFPKNSINV